MNWQRLRKLALENKIMLFLFLVSTTVFISQHALNLSWDFSTYVLNAKYWAGESQYYETQRAPLMPFILLILSPLGWKAAEYLFIILVSLGYLYSSIRVSEALNVRKDIFYLFSLTPYVLNLGLFNGTELLSLVLIEFFIASLLMKKSYAGAFLGLACLARYNFVVFFPLLLFDPNAIRLVKNSFYFAATLVPWFVYNFISRGNWFALIADSYALNVVYRADYIFQTASVYHFANLLTYLLPLFALGFLHTFYSWRKYRSISQWFLKEKETIIMILIILLTIYQYIEVPIKDIRYIFPLVLPVAYFSVMSLKSVMKYKKVIFIVSVILTIGLSIFLGIFDRPWNKEYYSMPIEKLNELGLSNCRILSNEWTVLNYLGRTAEPFPRVELITYNINQGNFIVLFFDTPEPEWVRNESFVSSFPIVYKNEDYVILGNNSFCNPIRIYDRTFSENLNETIWLIKKEEVSTDPCDLMFGNVHSAEKLCNIVNFKF